MTIKKGSYYFSLPNFCSYAAAFASCAGIISITFPFEVETICGKVAAYPVIACQIQSAPVFNVGFLSFLKGSFLRNWRTISVELEGFEPSSKTKLKQTLFHYKYMQKICTSSSCAYKKYF